MTPVGDTRPALWPPAVLTANVSPTYIDAPPSAACTLTLTPTNPGATTLPYVMSCGSSNYTGAILTFAFNPSPGPSMPGMPSPFVSTTSPTLSGNGGAGSVFYTQNFVQANAETLASSALSSAFVSPNFNSSASPVTYMVAQAVLFNASTVGNSPQYSSGDLKALAYGTTWYWAAPGSCNACPAGKNQLLVTQTASTSADVRTLSSAGGCVGACPPGTAAAAPSSAATAGLCCNAATPVVSNVGQCTTGSSDAIRPSPISGGMTLGAMSTSTLLGAQAMATVQVNKAATAWLSKLPFAPGCTSFTIINSTATSFRSKACGVCVDVWTFHAATTGPHTVVETCSSGCQTTSYAVVVSGPSWTATVNDNSDWAGVAFTFTANGCPNTIVGQALVGTWLSDAGTCLTLTPRGGLLQVALGQSLWPTAAQLATVVPTLMDAPLTGTNCTLNVTGLVGSIRYTLLLVVGT